MLDEPTNHLDSEAATWLEDYLRDYRGAVLVISHDRDFLDRVTGRTLELEHGKLTSYQGGYSQYMDKKEEDGLIAQRHYANVRREAKRIEVIIAQQKQWNRERNIRTAESKQKQLYLSLIHISAFFHDGKGKGQGQMIRLSPAARGRCV